MAFCGLRDINDVDRAILVPATCPGYWPAPSTPG